jgi:protein-S-isoprenylcysteine O-methyltransferase Ste14
VASAAVFHVAVAIAIFHPSHQYGQAVFDSVCKNTDSSAGALSTLPPKFIIGLILMLSGSAVRLWCYHTLGRFFTFEVAIMDDHVLITSGPYAYVRHPAYTASVAMVLATVLMMLGPDSFVQVCKVQTTFTGWLAVWSFRIPAIYGCFALVKCTGVEDSRLKNHFGTQWANYAQRVPYRLIPYVM